MGKTINPPHAESHGLDPASDDSVGSKYVEAPSLITAEQTARIAAVKEFFDTKEREYAALSEDEKRKIDEDWEVFKKSMNENHYSDGLPYPD